MKRRAFKMQGCGNDFLLLDAMDGASVPLTPEQVRFYCDRHFGIGADGLAVLFPDPTFDARWTFYNSDGSLAEMCGNAARCAVRYLSERRLHRTQVRLGTERGLVEGRLLSDRRVEVKLPFSVESIQYKERLMETQGNILQLLCVNTGVPHAVLEVKDLNTYPVERMGKFVQSQAVFQPEGTNVTFYQRIAGNQIRSTTFERGVAAETLACGTGAAAAALVFSEHYGQKLPIEVNVPGGVLFVGLDLASRALQLTGPAEYVFEVDLDLPEGSASGSL